jgi:hypothetical protein
MNKYVIAIWHEGSKGKSSTIRELAKLLTSTYPFTAIHPIPPNIPLRGDFRLVISIKNKIIGIESKGDPGTDLKTRLFELADQFNCTVIITATRTRGNTVDAVNDLCSQRGFDAVWTSTYQIDDASLHPRVNLIKAEHLHDLMVKLGII